MAIGSPAGGAIWRSAARSSARPAASCLAVMRSTTLPAASMTQTLWHSAPKSRPAWNGMG